MSVCPTCGGFGSICDVCGLPITQQDCPCACDVYPCKVYTHKRLCRKIHKGWHKTKVNLNLELFRRLGSR